MPANVPFENQLKDGVVLCNLINKISPGSVKKIQTKGTNFQLMENIQRYACNCIVHLAVRFWLSFPMSGPGTKFFENFGSGNEFF